jgi:alkylation response protein AidB-like acyl-CoA dehydrogenase
MEGLGLERLVGAIGAIAGIKHLEYMAQRLAFERPLNLHHRMAQLHAETQAIRSYVDHACRLFADGVYAVEECTIAKLLATELANKAA